MWVTADRIAPVLDLGVERSRDDGDTLSVLLRSSEPLDSTTIRLHLGEDPVPMRPLSRWGKAWRGTVLLTGASGAPPIVAQASDSAENNARTLLRIEAQSLRAGDGGSLVLAADAAGNGRSFRLSIPPNAMRRDAIVTMIPTDPGTAAPLPDSMEVLSTVVVQPADLLKAGVYVAFHYEAAQMSQNEAERLFIVGNSGALASYLDRSNQTVSAAADRLGDFRLVRGPKAANRPADASIMEAAVIGPNPFADATRLGVEVRAPQRLRITIHDVQGRQIRVLWDRPVLPGRLEFGWDGHATDGRLVPAGQYYCRVQGDRATRVIRLVRL